MSEGESCSIEAARPAIAGGDIGERFARSLAAKDFDGVASLLTDDVEFRALTPRRTWAADDPPAVLEILGTWFGELDRIISLDKLERDAFADRERVGYRLTVENPEGSFQLEQQAYLATDGERIAWLRVLCSGYRPQA
jgi:hypothetical protein